MKYNVTINNKTYEVEIEDINARPIIARVDGQRFEVAPANTDQPAVKKEASEPKTYAAPQTSAPASAANTNEIIAPLPGTVVEVFVKSGDKVEKGQVVLIIEAMKMKNSIRATRSGTAHEVLVSAGQSVAHKQVLIKFADAGEASWM
ncbi:MAG: acetyl-CoA carboxylase biotin carboxyl carrier protein subunit [Anaerolineales bacterium]|jgi:biotin carboxyl carrier protein|nr:acetyl-CoA carboxylase biotin carboxyl carrier protein subunit [Anaerolineales bacterium]MBP6207800.1 acetyl-CoA carboxylase biotin carboxyl carrier protein subunit [Anaerolineales bacterium]MBP8164388.1 acetyl-CoA carboxylase biotin carboxyl carrier protein subunit [Anaerolineales bacterium]